MEPLKIPHPVQWAYSKIHSTRYQLYATNQSEAIPWGIFPSMKALKEFAQSVNYDPFPLYFHTNKTKLNEHDPLDPWHYRKHATRYSLYAVSATQSVAWGTFRTLSAMIAYTKTQTEPFTYLE